MSNFIGRVAETTLVHLTASLSSKAVERGIDEVQKRWLTSSRKKVDPDDPQDPPFVPREERHKDL